MSSYTTGIDAEARCAAHLAAKGYQILHMRKRTAGGEIDIVAQTNDTLVLVEVKARKFSDSAFSAITPAKQRRLAQAAEALLAEYAEDAGRTGTPPPNMRFDVMAVLPDTSLIHMEDAWRP